MNSKIDYPKLLIVFEAFLILVGVFLFLAGVTYRITDLKADVAYKSKVIDSLIEYNSQYRKWLRDITTFRDTVKVLTSEELHKLIIDEKKERLWKQHNRYP